MKRKRKIIQVICGVLYNCNLTGFFKGTIYQGNVKGICVPGLNCYSCPGAVGACPLGSLQTALLSSRYKFPYYILGLLLLFGALLGRVICGFLCPFGLIQELFYKIPSKKIQKSKWTGYLSYVKYVVLAVFVIGIPLVLLEPGFCKYICPAGTLEGGIPLILGNEKLQKLAGALFSWKVAVLVLILLSAVFIFRSFCRFLCPLGAFYSLFYRVSVLGVEVDEERCSHCNACLRYCKMDIKKPGDRECIQCGECLEVCREEALRWKKQTMKPHRKTGR